ncbi:MAG: hypothetical protein R3C49_22395 [Planctomycetaceae bacterium]
MRDLSGFKKSHQVPDECSERAQLFIGRIAVTEISDDLNERFAEFRRHFGFRRTELQVTEPDDGFGAIQTPLFEYRMTVTQSGEDPAEAVFRRQVSEFRDVESLMSAEFSAAFGRLFHAIEFEPPVSIDVEAFIDHIEDQPEEDFSIDYDRTATWGRLTCARIPGTLMILPDRVTLTTTQPELPTRLLEAFLQFRGRLVGIECF